MLKIKLITPQSPFLINQKVFPNIGIVRTATQLKEKGYNVEILDFSGKEKPKIPPADIYGFSSTTPQFKYIFKLLEEVKDKYPNSHTVIGGPHASSLYHLKQRGIDDINIKDLEEFDTVFAGEAELDNVDLIFKKGWQKANLIKNLDDVLVPDRDLIDIISYKYNLNGNGATSIQSQRGCPGKCTFCCGRDIEMYKRVRQHSPERVVKELDELNQKYGYGSFMWYDDEININMSRLEELCDRLSKRDYKHRGFIRSDQMAKHPESAEWLKKAGFVKLCAGVETGSDRMSKAIKKQTTSKMHSEARKIVGEQGIHYESFMMMGHPDETIDDLLQTHNWILNNKPEDFDLNIVTPYPGSVMYNEAEPSDEFEGYNWEYNGCFFNKPRYSQEDSFYKGLDAQSHSGIRTKQLSNKSLKTLRNILDNGLRSILKK